MLIVNLQVQEEIESVVNTITHALKNCFSMPDLPDLIEENTTIEKELRNIVVISGNGWEIWPSSSLP